MDSNGSGVTCRILDDVSEHAYELHGDDPGAVERLVGAAHDGDVIYLTSHGTRIAAIVPARWSSQSSLPR